MKARSMVAVIGGKRYDTTKAKLIASDAYWDGHNWERHGRNTFLFRRPRGAYFALYQTQWEDERDTIEPLTEAEALRLWEDLPEKEVGFEEAFPGRAAEEA